MNYGSLLDLAEDWPAPYVLRVLPVASPAAATDFTITTPGESTWAVLAITATLTTDANVANRAATLKVTDGSRTLYQIAPGVVVTAGLTTVVSWLADRGQQSASIIGGTVNVQIPTIVMQPGYTVGPVTTAIQAADQWSAITMFGVEAFTGEREHERVLWQRWLDRLDALGLGLSRKV